MALHEVRYWKILTTYLLILMTGFSAANFVLVQARTAHKMNVSKRPEHVYTTSTRRSCARNIKNNNCLPQLIFVEYIHILHTICNNSKINKLYWVILFVCVSTAFEEFCLITIIFLVWLKISHIS